MLVEFIGGWMAGSLALLADAAHMLADVAALGLALIASVGALIAGVLVIVSGWLLADPLISILIGALVLVSAWRLVKESTDVLLEAAPRHIALSDVHDRIVTVPGVESVHDLHLWTVTIRGLALSDKLAVN